MLTPAGFDDFYDGVGDAEAGGIDAAGASPICAPSESFADMSACDADSGRADAYSTTKSTWRCWLAARHSASITAGGPPNTVRRRY